MVIRTIRAHPMEIVEVQWTLADGSMFVERHTVPPASTRDARVVENAAAQIVENMRNASGQVTDFAHSNDAGQRY